MSSLKTWSEDDRPREKLIQKGASSLSTAELLAIFLRTGTAELSALDLSRQILSEHDDNLANLAGISIDELTAYKGMGPAKAVTVIAALELARRIRSTSKDVRPRIKSASEAYEHLYQYLYGLRYEEFWMILLSRTSRVLSTVRLSEGGVAATVVDPKRLFKTALLADANAVILAHNHPSGNLKASRADIALTEKLILLGKKMELPIVDHLIFTDEGYLSMRDEGAVAW